MSEKNQKSILILEDEETTLTVLSEGMKKAGYKTHAFQRADAACVNVLVNEKIDLILLDLGLFGFDSTQILKFLQKEKVARNIPVIIISGKTVNEIEQAAKEIKAKAWIAKPFKIDEVMQKVTKAIE